jgi:hypothetical protein
MRFFVGIFKNISLPHEEAFAVAEIVRKALRT